MRQHLLPAVRATVVLALLTGLAWPLAFTAFAQAVFPRQAAGSLLRNEQGRIIGSSLLGQRFSKPEYFHPRPSAAGVDGYAGEASGGTNLGPTSARLLDGVHQPKTPDGKDNPDNFDGIKDLVSAYRRENGLASDALVPVDAVTRSGSGLDPHISASNARLQVKRVAKARRLSEDQVMGLVKRSTELPTLGILGTERVNVLALNLALDRLGR